MTKTTLVIVPCGSSKVWSKNPSAGPTIARDAYVGSPFKVNRRYAECVGDQWLILSAKYGFIDPDFVLPGPYEVTFKTKSSGPIDLKTLSQQALARGLAKHHTVIGLGGKEYRHAIETAFEGTEVELQFPFAGLPIGKAMQAAKRAAENSDTGEG